MGHAAYCAILSIDDIGLDRKRIEIWIPSQPDWDCSVGARIQSGFLAITSLQGIAKGTLKINGLVDTVTFQKKKILILEQLGYTMGENHKSLPTCLEY